MKIDNLKIPGVIRRSLPVSIGIALSLQLDKKDPTVCAILGNGEIKETIFTKNTTVMKGEVDKLICILDYK